MRGWKVGGIGPRDGGDSLGGEFAWATGLSVFAPIPGREYWPLKLHGFVNVGRVAGYNRCKCSHIPASDILRVSALIIKTDSFSSSIVRRERRVVICQPKCIRGNRLDVSVSVCQRVSSGAFCQSGVDGLQTRANPYRNQLWHAARCAQGGETVERVWTGCGYRISVELRRVDRGGMGPSEIRQSAASER